MSDLDDKSPPEDKKEVMETESSVDAGASGDHVSSRNAESNGESQHKPNEKGDVESEEDVKKANEGEKTPVKKTPTKRKKESEDDGSDDEEPEELKKGILEQPVVLAEGRKRERKKVERIEMTTITTPSKDKTTEIPEGCGEKLGDMPRVEFMINRHKADELKPLHRVLFNKLATKSAIKSNIRKFCGFSFKKPSPEYNNKMASLNKLKMSALKSLCEVLDVDKKGTKDNVVERLMEFLLMPAASGKKVPQPKKRRSSKGSAGKGTKRKRKSKTANEKTKKSKKKAKSKEQADSSDDEEDEEEDKEDANGDDDDDDADDDADDDQDEKSDESDEGESEEEEEEESEDEAPKKKKQKVSPKTPAKKTKQVEKTVKKKQSKKAESASSDDDSDSDDEPLKPKTKSAPTNDEIKKVVKGILDHANLEEITMKTVCRQVFDKYPDFDLTDRKDFIKTTVKQFIR